jgi:hypothetical protein
MCTCITHKRKSSRAFYVLRFTHYYHVTCDLRWCVIASWHDVFNEQFIFFLRFLLVNSTTPKRPRQPRLVARTKVPGGGSWNLGRSNLRQTRSFNIYRRRHVYGSSLTVHLTLWKLTHFLRRRFAALPSLRLPCSGLRESSVSEPTLVIWDLHGCRWIRFLGSALTRPLALFLPRVLHRRLLHLFVHGIHYK